MSRTAKDSSCPSFINLCKLFVILSTVLSGKADAHTMAVPAALSFTSRQDCAKFIGRFNECETWKEMNHEGPRWTEEQINQATEWEKEACEKKKSHYEDMSPTQQAACVNFMMANKLGGGQLHYWTQLDSKQSANQCPADPSGDFSTLFHRKKQKPLEKTNNPSSPSDNARETSNSKKTK